MLAITLEHEARQIQWEKLYEIKIQLTYSNIALGTPKLSAAAIYRNLEIAGRLLYTCLIIWWLNDLRISLQYNFIFSFWNWFKSVSQAKFCCSSVGYFPSIRIRDPTTNIENKCTYNLQN